MKAFVSSCQQGVFDQMMPSQHQPYSLHNNAKVAHIPLTWTVWKYCGE